MERVRFAFACVWTERVGPRRSRTIVDARSHGYTEAIEERPNCSHAEDTYGLQVEIAGVTRRDLSLEVRIMNRHLSHALIALLTVAACRQKWEYRVVSVPDAQFETMMNAFGADGWDVVSARRASDGTATFSYELILKRTVSRWNSDANTGAVAKKLVGDKALRDAQVARLSENVVLDASDHTFHRPSCKLVVKYGGVRTAREAIGDGWKPSPDCKPMEP